jgi:hypothetical protein
MRTFLVAAMAASLLALGAGPAAGRVSMQAQSAALADTRAATTAKVISPCSDGAYNLIGAKWTDTLKWQFRAGSTPAGLSRTGVESVLKQAFANVTGARNDCGLGDNVSATAAYTGTTTRKPSCSTYDGYNVIGFKSLSGGTLARTCYWMMGDRIIEADIIINSNSAWALSVAGCLRRSLLEATMTHEVGHAFGLDHVAELTHGRLTMSPMLDALCNNNESTLGLGDVRGLEALY